MTSRFEDEIAALPGLSAIIHSEEAARDYPDGLPCIALGRDWLLAGPAVDTDLPATTDAVRTAGRICFSSGTTGKPKAMALTAELLIARLTTTAQRTLINARSVLWCGLGPDTAYGFTATMAAWAEGGTVVMARGGQGDYRVLGDRQVNLLLASPAAFATLLRDASSTDLPPLSATAIVAGGRLPISLRDALQSRLCPEVLVAFGASETGGITLGPAVGLDAHVGYVGQAFADAGVRIVDEAGHDLAPGAVGQLWMRSKSAVAAYLGDAGASAGQFNAGWFVSGDLARLSQDRVLTILGRTADTFNLGGVKWPAAEIDLAARQADRVEDACAVVLAPDSNPQLAVIVAGEVSDGEGLAALIRAKLPQLPQFALVCVAALPRSSMGKVNRVALAQQVGAALANPDATQFRLIGYF